MKPALNRHYLLIMSLILPKNAPILDAGSGTCSLLPSLLASEFNNVTATDINDVALAQAVQIIGSAGED